MESSLEIAKLCESWWERLSDSTKEDHGKYVERFLALLGWTDLTHIDTTWKEGPLSKVSFMLRGDAESTVAAHFVLPGSLEPPTSLVERGLDFCENTRLLVNGSRKLNAHYAFVTDLSRSYLYDVQTDELLLYGDTPEAFNGELAGVLTRANVERGSLEEVRRHPRSHAARQLREWCHHWCETLVARSRLDEEVALLSFDRLLVLRYLFDHDILKRSDWRLRRRFSEVTAKAFEPNPQGCGKALTTLFHDIWFDWKAGLFEPHPALDEVLGDDAVAAPMLKEFALLSKTKFTIATILESFNYGEAMEKARVRMVPEPDEERTLYIAKQTLRTVDEAQIEVDVLEEGYRAIFFWLDKMVALYDKLGVEFDMETYGRQPASQDLDLFAWSELDAKRPEALQDTFRHGIEKGIVVYYASPRQHRTARLMLYLYLISQYERGKLRFSGFPHVEATLVERPRLLESDRKWIYQPPSDPHSPEWGSV